MTTEARGGSAFLPFGRTRTAAGRRLYAFAHAGGTASAYAPWARLLAPTVEIVGIELPGHGIRMDEEPLTDVHAMAEEIAAQLQAAEDFAETRTVFYGHSLGAIVAFEVARILWAQQRIGPAHLFVGAARAPHLPPTLPAISQLAEEPFLAAVQQRYGGLPAEVLNEAELMEMILPAMRADFTAYENYEARPGAALAIPISAYFGAFDSVVQEAAVAAWADHTTGSFRLQGFPGDHFFLTACREQLLSSIARELNAVELTQQT